MTLEKFLNETLFEGEWTIYLYEEKDFENMDNILRYDYKDESSEHIVAINSELFIIASAFLLPKYAFAEVTNTIVGKDNKIYVFLKVDNTSGIVL